jgi:hypothetical protein
LFLDADMVVTGDICELFDCADYTYDLQMQTEQPKFEWPSAMLFNNARCRVLTPEFIENPENKLFNMEWAKSVGSFPAEWNHCVGYTEPKDAKLYHYTQGIPCWMETQGLPEDVYWFEETKALKHTVSWKELMGTSVHAKPVLKRFLAKYAVNH